MKVFNIFSKKKVVTKVVGLSRTKQADKEACDIHNIVKRGFLPPTEMPVFDDVATDMDYQDALNSVMEANKKFALLPSNVRKKFNNNPAALLDFLSNSANFDEAVDLGLAKRRELDVTEKPKESTKDDVK